jgi:hypothetical protein
MLHTAAGALSSHAHAPERDATPARWDDCDAAPAEGHTSATEGGTAQVQHPGAVSVPQRRALS